MDSVSRGPKLRLQGVQDWTVLHWANGLPFPCPPGACPRPEPSLSVWAQHPGAIPLSVGVSQGLLRLPWCIPSTPIPSLLRFPRQVEPQALPPSPQPLLSTGRGRRVTVAMGRGGQGSHLPSLRRDDWRPQTHDITWSSGASNHRTRTVCVAMAPVTQPSSYFTASLNDLQEPQVALKVTGGGQWISPLSLPTPAPSVILVKHFPVQTSIANTAGQSGMTDSQVSSVDMYRGPL